MATVPLLLVASIVLVMVVCIAVVNDRRQRRVELDLDHTQSPPGSPAPLLPQEPSAHAADAEPLCVPVQLLFAEQRHNGMQIDCIILEPVHRGSHVTEAGTPIVLKVRPLRTQEVAPVLESLVNQWADEGKIVSLELDERKPGPKLCLHTETSKIRFDVDDRGRDPITKRRWR